MDDYEVELRQLLFRRINVIDETEGYNVKLSYKLGSHNFYITEVNTKIDADFIMLLPSKNKQKIHKQIYAILKIVVQDFIKPDLLLKIENEIRETKPGLTSSQYKTEAQDYFRECYYYYEPAYNYNPKDQRDLIKESMIDYFRNYGEEEVDENISKV